MNVTPLAFDSMGVRSMCTFVEDDIAILIDPGVSLAPQRFGLPPHNLELEQLMRKRELIQKYAEKTDIITISHWHNDHHTPFIHGLYNSVTPETARELYKGKTVLGKGFNNLNYMQEKRALSFLNYQKVNFCDGKSYTYGNVTITFSRPANHGLSAKIYVVMVAIEGEKKVVHASDIQGFSGLSFIKEENPDILIMSGPPAYLLTLKEIQRSESNILDVLDSCGQCILDHHHVRDKTFKEVFREIWKSFKVKTAAEYTGSRNQLLEAERNKLFTELPQSSV